MVKCGREESAWGEKDEEEGFLPRVGRTRGNCRERMRDDGRNDRVRLLTEERMVRGKFESVCCSALPRCWLEINDGATH